MCGASAIRFCNCVTWYPYAGKQVYLFFWFYGGFLPDIISDKICSKTNNRNQGMVTKLNAIKGTGK